MIKKITFLLCLTVPLFCLAQNGLTVEYDYDAAGNRISRKVINLQSAPPVQQVAVAEDFPEVELVEPEYFVDKVARMEMKIYPNPATERITLEISNWEDLQMGTFKLFSLSGQLLQEQPVHSPVTSISLAGLSKGAYILKVCMNNKTEDLKIIKQ